MSSFTPASIVVDFSDSDLHGATNLAQQFCSSINKNAQYVTTNIDNGWISKKKEAFFNCAKSNKLQKQSNPNIHVHTMPIINNFK